MGGIRLTLAWSVFALAIPSAAFVWLNDTIADNTGLAIVFALLYEGLLFALFLIKDVGQELRAEWVRRLAQHTDVFLRQRFSRYGSVYREKLVADHRYLDLSAISSRGSKPVELSQLFVDPTLRPTSLSAGSARASASRPYAEATHVPSPTIWDLLRNHLAGRCILVLGNPGSGKTLLLRHVTLTLALRRKDPRRARIPWLLPILLPLNRDMAEAIKSDPASSLAEFIRKRSGQLRVPEPPQWFEKQLRGGRCLVMLDGMDEVPNLEQRRFVASWIQEQLARYPHVRFVLTSRPSIDGGLVPSAAEVFQIESFTLTQVEHFLTNWTRAAHISGLHNSESDASAPSVSELLTQLRTRPELWGLVGNPLLLTMIAGTQEDVGSLPRKRFDLYSRICRIFLSGRAQTLTSLDAIHCQRVLGHLAYHMVVARSLEITAAEAKPIVDAAFDILGYKDSNTFFLDSVSEKSGLIVEREHAGVRSYSFTHRTFQEFLAAAYMREHARSDDELTQLVTDPWWLDTLCFYGSGPNGSRVIHACLQLERPSVEALTLAAACAQDTDVTVSPEVQARLEAALSEDREHRDPARQRSLREVKLTLRLREMALLGVASFASPSVITNAEYQLFVDDMRERGEPRHLDHWKEGRFPVQAAPNPATGVRASDAEAFCAWLTERDRNGWCYRLPHEGELQEHWRGRLKLGPEGIPHWEKIEGELTCWPKPHRPSVRRTLWIQLHFDILQDLSPSMQRNIDPQHWRKLHNLVPKRARSRQHLGLNPQVLLKLDLSLRSDNLVALGVALIQRRRLIQAEVIGRRLGVDHVSLLIAHAILRRALAQVADAPETDLDSVLVTVLEICSYTEWLAKRSRWAHMERLRMLGITLRAATDCALNRADQAQLGESTTKVLRWCARLTALVLAHEIARMSGGSSVERIISRSRLAWNPILPQGVRDCLSVYTGLALVEARSRGEGSLGAGIVVVKEGTREAVKGQWRREAD